MTAPADTSSASGHSTSVESITSDTDSFDCNPPALIAGVVVELKLYQSGNAYVYHPIFIRQARASVCLLLLEHRITSFDGLRSITE